MTGKAVVIEHGGKPLFVARIKEMDTSEVLLLERVATANRNQLIENAEGTKEEIRSLKAQIEELKREIAYLKGE